MISDFAPNPRTTRVALALVDAVRGSADVNHVAFHLLPDALRRRIVMNLCSADVA